MRLLISDTNILINMEVGGSLTAMFHRKHPLGISEVLISGRGRNVIATHRRRN
jgi:hypothetical protein